MQYNNVLKLKEGVEHRISDLEKEEQRIDQIGAKYQKLIDLSNEIKTKTGELETTSDKLQSLEVNVRNYKDIVESITGKIDKLDQKHAAV